MNSAGESLIGKITARGAARTLSILCCWTASFDLFLNIDVGVNIRLCQLLLAAAMLLSLPSIVNDFKARRLCTPPGGLALLGWLLVVVVMSASASNAGRGPGYAVWAILCVASTWLVSELFGKPQRLQYLFNAYLAGFMFVAWFGMIQFLLPFLHISPPLVQQWWIEDVLPRANGFSYEPSYYATYLLMGYIPASHVLSTSVLPKRQIYLMRWVRWSTLVAIILSSSRMGLLFVLLWEVPRIAGWCMAVLYKRSTRGLLILVAATILSIVAVAYVLARYSDEVQAARFLLNGLGFEGTASHSVDERSNGFRDTIKVFMSYPMFGVGLGSVAEHIAALQGRSPNTYAELKDFEGLSIFAEALAGTGIVGFGFLITFITRLFVSAYQRAAALETLFLSRCTIGLVWAGLFELGILQLNQNILRPYLWLHLGVIGAVTISVSKKSAPESLIASGARPS